MKLLHWENSKNHYWEFHIGLLPFLVLTMSISFCYSIIFSKCQLKKLFVLYISWALARSHNTTRQSTSLSTMDWIVHKSTQPERKVQRVINLITSLPKQFLILRKLLSDSEKIEDFTPASALGPFYIQNSFSRSCKETRFLLRSPLRANHHHPDFVQQRSCEVVTTRRSFASTREESVCFIAGFIKSSAFFTSTFQNHLDCFCTKHNLCCVIFRKNSGQSN